MGTIRARPLKKSMQNQLSNGFDSRRLHHYRLCRTNKNNALRIGTCRIPVWIGIDSCRDGHDLGTLHHLAGHGLTCAASNGLRCNPYTEVV